MPKGKKRLFLECDLVQVPVKRGFIKKSIKKNKKKNYVKLLIKKKSLHS